MFEFYASFVRTDKQCRRLSFADRNGESGEHYFIMDRSEESPQEFLPDMGNVYIERDDQLWGGFGGIERVILERHNLTLHLAPRMATQMGDHSTIRVLFALSDCDFRELRDVLGLIMHGYVPQLDLFA